MTIAIISMIRDSWGGSEEIWADLASHALSQGHRVVHLGYEAGVLHPKMKALMEMGLQHYERPGYIKPGSSNIGQLIQTGKNFIRKKLKNHFKPVFEQKPDLLLYNGTCYSIAAEKQLVQELDRTGLPFYIIAHLNSDFLRDINDLQATFIRNTYTKAKGVFFVSQRTKLTAERHLCMEIRNASIIRNPVNLTDTSPLPYPSLKNGINMAVVANLATIHKGQDILLHALASVPWQARNWQLNIYGSGYDEQYLKDLVKYLGLEQKVKFQGRVQDIRKVWSTNHLLVLPSHMEGMPLAVVEAMLCGRPSVVTDVGGNTEWVEEGKSGLIAAAASIHALSEALERAWSRSDHWEQMGIAAHKRAMALYDPNAGETLLNLLKSEHGS